jgi:hypothetical protein
MIKKAPFFLIFIMSCIKNVQVRHWYDISRENVRLARLIVSRSVAIICPKANELYIFPYEKKWQNYNRSEEFNESFVRSCSQ